MKQKNFDNIWGLIMLGKISLNGYSLVNSSIMLENIDELAS